MADDRSMNARDTKLVQWLNEAHAKEAELEADLTAHIALTQLHPQEMVLPADLANRVRDGSVGGGGSTYHVTIQAMDAKSFRDFAHQNSDAFHDAVRRGQTPELIDALRKALRM